MFVFEFSLFEFLANLQSASKLEQHSPIARRSFQRTAAGRNGRVGIDLFRLADTGEALRQIRIERICRQPIALSRLGWVRQGPDGVALGGIVDDLRDATIGKRRRSQPKRKPKEGDPIARGRLSGVDPILLALSVRVHVLHRSGRGCSVMEISPVIAFSFTTLGPVRE